MKKLLLAVLSVVFLLPVAAQAQGPYHPYHHRYRHCYWRYHHRHCYWR